MGVKEMNGENEAGRQQGLIRVDHQSDINEPAGHKPSEERRIPHYQSGGANNRHAPEHREVVELFPIRPPVELWFRSLAKKPLIMREEVLPILPGWDHR